MRSATTSYWSDERGIIQPEIIALYSKLAMGRVGLIVKGHLYVKDSGKVHVRMAGISHDYHVPNLKMLTNEVHKYGSKIVAQLNHGGINSLIDKAGPSPYLVDDEKTGVPHLASALACIGVLIDAIECEKLNDDRPPQCGMAALLDNMEKKVIHLQQLFPDGPDRHTAKNKEQQSCE